MYKVLSKPNPLEEYLISDVPPENNRKYDAWLNDYRRSSYYKQLSEENKNLVNYLEIDKDGIDYLDIARITKIPATKMEFLASILPGTGGHGIDKRFYHAAVAQALFIYQ